MVYCVLYAKTVLTCNLKLLLVFRSEMTLPCLIVFTCIKKSQKKKNKVNTSLNPENTILSKFIIYWYNVIASKMCMFQYTKIYLFLNSKKINGLHTVPNSFSYKKIHSCMFIYKYRDKYYRCVCAYVHMFRHIWNLLLFTLVLFCY